MHEMVSTTSNHVTPTVQNHHSPASDPNMIADSDNAAAIRITSMRMRPRDQGSGMNSNGGQRRLPPASTKATPKVDQTSLPSIATNTAAGEKEEQSFNVSGTSARRPTACAHA